MIIAIAGTKGGIGKSTISICLSVEAKEHGRRTLLVDADLQGTCMRWSQVAHIKNISIPTVTAVNDGYYRDGQLNALARGFDWTILDCPPRLGVGLKGAFMVCDLAIVPCRPTYADAWGLEDTVELIREAQKARPELQAVVLLTGVKGRTALAKSVREVLSPFGLTILSTEIHDRTDYQSVLGGGVTLRKHAPRSEALKEMHSLFDELNRAMVAEEQNDTAIH